LYKLQAIQPDNRLQRFCRHLTAADNTKGVTMARISTVSPEKAEGVIKQGYEMFMEKVGIIPKPMEMMSASPALFDMQLKRIGYYSKHPALGFALLVHIRYLAAHTLNYSFCQDFNGLVLKKLGLTDDDIRNIEADPENALLEDNEKAMLAFVIKSMKKPDSITQSDIDSLKELGWADRDMVDALAQGVSMIDHSIMMQVFGIDQNCLVPA
jgi:hypothetical protein